MVVLVLMKGYPGCGKSHLANALAKELGFAIIDKDDARDALQSLSGAVPVSILNDISYDIMVNFVRRLVTLGNDVIVDCPLSRQSLYLRIKAIAKENNGQILVVECISSNIDLWSKRLHKRSRMATQEACHKPASMEDIQRLMLGYQGRDKWHLQEEELEILSLDTTKLSCDEQIDAVKAYVAKLRHMTKNIEKCVL